jgi:aspartate racemase
VIYQVNQNRCADDMESGRWGAVTDTLVEATGRLQAAGADLAVIASNTPHMVFDEVQRRTSIPLLSIVEETCTVVADRKLKKVGLLATRITMQGGFYQEVFGRQGIQLVIPREAEQARIHQKITNELVAGILREETRRELMEVAHRMVRDDGIEGVILDRFRRPARRSVPVESKVTTGNRQSGRARLWNGAELRGRIHGLRIDCSTN